VIVAQIMFIDRLVVKWKTRSKLRDKMEAERALHSIMSISIVDDVDDDKKEEEEEKEEGEEEKKAVVGDFETKEEKCDNNRTNASFEALLKSFGDVSTETELLSAIKKMSTCVSKSTSTQRVIMRKKIVEFVRRKKLISYSSIWTSRVRNAFGDLLRDTTPLYSFLRILMDEISME